MNYSKFSFSNLGGRNTKLTRDELMTPIITSTNL